MSYLRLAVALLAFGLVSVPAMGQEKAKFYVGASSKTLGYSPLWVGLKKGLFDQQGLDAQLLLLRGSTMTVQAMAGASLHWLFENKEAAVDFLTVEMQLKPSHARRGWEYYTQNRIWSPDGDLNLEGMKYNLRIYAEQAGIKGPPPNVAKFIDQSYLHEALKELNKRS